MSAFIELDPCAFPCDEDVVEAGMTLRDYFAAHSISTAAKKFPDGAPDGWDDIAAVAYMIAESMMKAREGK